jgi:hypothetical protein
LDRWLYLYQIHASVELDRHPKAIIPLQWNEVDPIRAGGT